LRYPIADSAVRQHHPAKLILSPEFVALVEEILGEEAEAATSATAR
jgi:hypothetical protein